MTYTHDLQLARALGSKRYTDAIELLRLEIGQATPETKG